MRRRLERNNDLRLKRSNLVHVPSSVRFQVKDDFVPFKKKKTGNW